MDIETIMKALGEPMRYRIWNCLLEYTHYLPKPEAVEQLLKAAQIMYEKSQRLDRNIQVFQCEF